MPLIQSRSKKAQSKNIETEMHAGKPQDQAIAISYAVKRKNAKKKMAEGGMAYRDDSAKTERRPMPNNVDNSQAMVSRNQGDKPPMNDSWTSRVTVEQAQKPSKTKLSRPQIVKGGTFATRDLSAEEESLPSNIPPTSPDEQPNSEMDEQGANRQGPRLHDMEDEHSTSRKPYAKGGRVQDSDYDASPNKYMDDLTDLPPSEDEGSSMADSKDEMGQDRQGPEIHDNEAPHSEHSLQFDDVTEDEHQYNNTAEDMDGSPLDSNSQPRDEAAEMHHASVAAAVMAKMDREKEDNMSGMPGYPVNMARGGEILSEDSMETSDDTRSDLSRNHDEDANMEDKSSFDALRKENYNDSNLDIDQPEDSGEHGRKIMSDLHDNIDDIIAHMRAKARSRR